MLLDKWVQTFREKISFSVSKGHTSRTILPVDDINKIFNPKVPQIITQSQGNLKEQTVLSTAEWDIHLSHECGKFSSPTYRPPLFPANIPGTSTPDWIQGPDCGRKCYVNE
jgi:hypothetical protein